MKRSKTVTRHIIVRAETNSEWDHVGFAIIGTDLFTGSEMIKRLEMLKSLNADELFCSVCYDDQPYGFWSHAGPRDSWVDHYLFGNRTWSYVLLEEEEMDHFELPENKLIYYELVLTSGSEFYFKATGKHTGELFWTASLPISILLNQ